MEIEKTDLVKRVEDLRWYCARHEIACVIFVQVMGEDPPVIGRAYYLPSEASGAMWDAFDSVKVNPDKLVAKSVGCGELVRPESEGI